MDAESLFGDGGKLAVWREGDVVFGLLGIPHLIGSCADVEEWIVTEEALCFELRLLPGRLRLCEQGFAFGRQADQVGAPIVAALRRQPTHRFHPLYITRHR